MVKLLGIIAGVLIVTAAVALSISLGVVIRGFDDFVQSEVEHNNNGSMRILEDWDWTLKAYSQVSARNPAIAEALETGDYSYISNYLKFMDELDMEMIAVTDAKGVVLPGCGIGLDPKTNLSNLYCVQEALRGTPKSSYEAIGSSPIAMIHAAPVKSGSKVVGTVVSVYDLTTEDLVTVMQNGYNVDCTIFSGDTRVATTLKGMLNTKLDNKAIIDQVLHTGKRYDGRNVIKGVEYFTTYAPLVNDNGEVKGMLFIAKPLSIVNSIRNKTLLWSLIVLSIVFVILMIACYRFIHWLMWRIYNVTNFLNEMETGEADLTKRCKLFIRDEMGDLIISFDRFLDKMQKMISELKVSKNDLAEAGTSMSTSAHETSSAITEIIANIDGISSQVNNQVRSVTQTADAVDEISKRITGLDDMIENQSAGVSEASTAVEEMIGNI
ncbi:MAG: methyl-accepting chemotaxis protein, partial [Treponema sp.]|nr:methyl-accepting chemotaxis protein [Treponema sp.]